MTKLQKHQEETGSKLSKILTCKECDGYGEKNIQIGEFEHRLEKCEFCHTFRFPVLELVKQREQVLSDKYEKTLSSINEGIKKTLNKI